MSIRLYHRVPQHIEGRFLQPLNLLLETCPKLYQEYKRKYEGREFVLSGRVPNLNCLWNDVLHFSPVHPELICQALSEAGISYRPSKWFSVDPVQHDFNRENASIFLHPHREPDDIQDHVEDFIDYSYDELTQFRLVPAATKKYFELCKETDINPLMFCWVPHVLYRGQLEISALEIIEA